MQIKKAYWQIAYRKERERIWELVSNPKGGWTADPFLFEYHGKLYLFAEIMPYRTGRGYIGYCEYDGGNFGPWKTAVKEKWHLSYPDVFEWNGKIYMLPEQYQSGEIALYECIDFPSRWKRLAPLVKGGQYADSTVLFWNGRVWLFTLCMNPKKHSEGKLLRAELFSPEKLGEFEVIDEEGGLYKRPGGRFFMRNDKTYRVAQNCEGEYGRGLIYYLVGKCDGEGYEERKEKCIYPQSIALGKMNKEKGYIGIHTYNECGGMKVIDLKQKVFLIEEFFWRAKRKMGDKIKK